MDDTTQHDQDTEQEPQDTTPEPQGTRTERPHGGNGDFIATMDTAERDANMARMRSRGAEYRAIAREHGVSVSTAFEGVKRALQAARAEAGEEARQMELIRLDRCIEQVETVLARQHVVVHAGQVVRRQVGVEDRDGEQVPVYEDVVDDEPVLRAVDRLIRLSESRRKLLGLDAAEKMEVGGSVTYQVVGVAQEDL